MTERNNLLKDFTKYIEHLCSIHKKIRHSETEKHFIRLDSMELGQSISANLHFPVVTMEGLTTSYTDMPDNYRKKREVEMMFLDQVTVTGIGDSKLKERVQSEMEYLAETFILKFRNDKRNGKIPHLKLLNISDVQIDYVENVDTLLWGVLLSFNCELPFTDCLSPCDFDE